MARTPGFITYVNFQLGHVRPDPADAEALERFEALGIEPGADFDPARLDAETSAAIRTGIDAALERLQTRVASNKDNIGLFGRRSCLGEDCGSRAVGAMIGICRQNESEAICFSCQADADGKPIDGTKTCEPSFEQAPPVPQVWSLTMCNLPARLLVDDPIGRCSIGDRTEGLVEDENGGVTITTSPSDPGEGRNRLPTPDGNFFMAMRLHGPGEAIASGEWPRPQPVPSA